WGRHHLGIRGRLFLGIGGRDHFGIRGRIASEFAYGGRIGQTTNDFHCQRALSSGGRYARDDTPGSTASEAAR
ncbi:hypothetical protein CN123_18320, partial [Sinorhizobium meliloti]